ncbi:MAG: hypothetical protein KKD86_02020 [Bacteroidetes bacterium]|nr:hypothetical protein [Bacteroidota bacterium]
MESKIYSILFTTLFSIVLWLFVSFSHEYSTSVELPVKIVSIPDGYAVNEFQPKKIMFNIKGKGWQLSQFMFGFENDLEVNSQEKEGQHTASVRTSLEQNRWYSSSTQLGIVSPELVSYSLEKIKRKKIKIIHHAELSFKPGYGLVSEISIIPDSVIVFGPKSKIDKLEFIRTVSTKYKRLEKKVNYEVLIEVQENFQLEQELVRIEFDVQKIVDKTFEDVFVRSDGVPRSRELSLFPTKIKIVLRGGINKLGKLTDSQINASVNFRQAIEDTSGSLAPNIEVPAFTQLIDIIPKRLEYIIKQY